MTTRTSLALQADLLHAEVSLVHRQAGEDLLLLKSPQTCASTSPATTPRGEIRVALVEVHLGYHDTLRIEIGDMLGLVDHAAGSALGHAHLGVGRAG
ncbi:MAG: hypothetical protein R3F11_20645 [Verrucomicrobiales bacterium]